MPGNKWIEKQSGRQLSNLLAMCHISRTALAHVWIWSSMSWTYRRPSTMQPSLLTCLESIYSWNSAKIAERLQRNTKQIFDKMNYRLLFPRFVRSTGLHVWLSFLFISRDPMRTHFSFEWEIIFLVSLIIDDDEEHRYCIEIKHIPNMASMNTAINPTASMTMVNGSIKYVMMAPTNHTTSIKSKYDWKSVHAQKYFGSKSASIEMRKNKQK